MQISGERTTEADRDGLDRHVNGRSSCIENIIVQQGLCEFVTTRKRSITSIECEVTCFRDSQPKYRGKVQLKGKRRIMLYITPTFSSWLSQWRSVLVS